MADDVKDKVIRILAEQAMLEPSDIALTQTLEDLGEDRCRYANEERVHGLASWLVALFFRGVVRRSIEAVGEALKSRVENC